jgi:hypothetical protein
MAINRALPDLCSVQPLDRPISSDSTPEVETSVVRTSRLMFRFLRSYVIGELGEKPPSMMLASPASSSTGCAAAESNLLRVLYSRFPSQNGQPP